ncbi:MAG TPA: M48 family metallopeptidase [Thermoanaerobaculia bacterium]|nr:M48 family metallopeptidase [Thermoanaerobaculia bacterium]
MITHRPRILSSALPIVLTALIVFGCAGSSVQAGGFNLVSLDQEWQMREDLRAQVAHEYRLVNDPQALAYINEVGRRIAAQTPYGNRRWDFGIVDDSSVNAFNLPGGLVYVHSGLIAEADTLDQLVGVLAHEIGHGASRHGTQLMSRAYGYNLLAGLALGRNASQTKQILAQVVGAGVMTDYSRDAEREADRLGVNYAYRAGYDPDGAADFFRQLLDLRQRRPTRVEQFFSSHPLTEERIHNVETAAASLSRGRNLIDDTQAYQRFRSRFR